jgi:hypothetical protein
MVNQAYMKLFCAMQVSCSGLLTSKSLLLRMFDQYKMFHFFSILMQVFVVQLTWLSGCQYKCLLDLHINVHFSMNITNFHQSNFHLSVGFRIQLLWFS